MDAKRFSSIKKSRLLHTCISATSFNTVIELAKTDETQKLFLSTN